jgi:predicted DsbA family dithiol-disulfide isomerase
MKVEIWSDVMCPFCYIGKRHLEKALAVLPFKNEIEVEWKSYQLNPEYHNTTNENLYDYLGRAKGISVQQAKQLTTNVVEMAKNAGLELDFDKSIPANSFDAHRLIHFAKSKGLQDEAEEALFHSHFNEGKDIGKVDVLVSIAEGIGLNKNEVEGVLQTDEFTEQVRYDIYESQQFGVRGVPYFILDRKYALSGAQPIEAFEAALEQSYKEWKKAQSASQVSNLDTRDAAACGDDGCAI